MQFCLLQRRLRNKTNKPNNIQINQASPLVDLFFSSAQEQGGRKSASQPNSLSFILPLPLTDHGSVFLCPFPEIHAAVFDSEKETRNTTNSRSSLEKTSRSLSSFVFLLTQEHRNVELQQGFYNTSSIANCRLMFVAILAQEEL